MLHLRVHGDNIVEFERTLGQIGVALELDDLSGPSGLAVTPSLQTESQFEKVRFDLFPGFGRWDIDILDVVRRRGGVLREAPDAIVTQVHEGSEEIRLAIEYCAALAAGNQAWQRSGRALSYSLAGVPYLYLTELGGWELDALRKRKAMRLPNPAVPFSYVSHSLRVNAPTVPIYVRSPATNDTYKAVFGDTDLPVLLEALLTDEQPASTLMGPLANKCLDLVAMLADSRRRQDCLTGSQWMGLYEALVAGQSATEFLVGIAMPWRKTAYISNLTRSADALIRGSTKYAVAAGRVACRFA